MLKNKFKVVVGFVFGLSSLVGYAADPTNIRKTYLSAEKLIWNANSKQFKNLYRQLHYYPLRPYLDQKLLLNKMSIKNANEIENFLTEYSGSPLDWTVRKKWLQYLAKRNNKLLFIKSFKPTSNATLTCQYYRFKLDLGAPEQDILPKVTKLWLKGRSQPKACDPLFSKWQAAGYKTNDVVWQRVVLAADGGDHTLLPYLKKSLPKEEQYLADLWKKVRANPAYIGKLSRFPNTSDKEAAILTYGLKRLIWRNQKLAIDTYQKAQQKFTFTEQQHNEIVHRYALALASKNHELADLWLAKVPESHMDKGIIQWRLANVLRKNDWQAVKNELETFPTSKQSALQWQYWFGRSLLETGNKAQGQAVLKQAADQRHYYGFLAAAHLNQAVNYRHQPIEITEQEKMTVMALPSAKRALELFHLGRLNQARREWNSWLSHLSSRERLVASKIAHGEQWYDRAIFSLSKEGYLDDVDLRFPLAYEEEIIRFAKQQKINPAWSFAIARRESSFMRDAHSPVGAKGLMQLMPNTAKQLQKKKVSTQYLYNAENNIRLGSLYLKKLSDRYKGNNVLATASYNAGPYRVSQWVKKAPVIAAEVWIETIPYKETREYVKSVLAYQQIYQDKIGQQEHPFEQLLAMDIAP